MDHGEGIFALGIANRFRKKDSIFVIDQCKVTSVAFQAIARQECGESEPLPMEQVLGGGKGDARAIWPEGSVSHHVAAKLFDEGDAWILASAATGTQLVLGLWLEGYSYALNADRIAVIVKLDASDANARKIPRRDKARKEVEMSIGTARGPGI
jgi:hypothetical protein